MAATPPSTPETPPAPPRPGLSLRWRLVLALTLMVLLAVLGLGVFGYLRVTQTTNFLQDQLRDTVRRQAEQSLRSRALQESETAYDALNAIADDVTSLAASATALLAQEAELGHAGYWDAAQRFTRLPNGLWDNDNADMASVYASTKVKSLSADLTREVNTLRYLDFSAPQILSTHPNVVATYFVNPQGVTIYYPNADLANVVGDFDVANGVWFTSAAPEDNPQRKTVWTVPYQDPALTGLLITSSAPVYDGNGQFRGVVSADVQLAKITSDVSAIRVAQTGYAMLIDSAGRIIAMPEAGYRDLGLAVEDVPINETPKLSVLGQGSAEWQAVTARMAAGENGVSIVELNGVPRYVAYVPLKSVNFSLALVAPVAEMEAQVVEISNRLTDETRTTLGWVVAILVGVLVLAVVVSWFVGQRLTAPLELLTRTAQRITAGDLHLQAPATSGDEIGTLARAFNSMTSQLRQTLDGLQNRTRDLSLSVEINRALAQERRLDALLAQAVELIRSRFELYYAQIYLVDESGRYLELHAGTGEVGRQLAQGGQRVLLDTQSFIGAAAVERRAALVADTAASPAFRPNPLLPNSKAELAVPLLIGDRLLGVLHVLADRHGVLTRNTLSAFDSLTGQLAIAIENAQLFAQAERARLEVEAQARRLTRAGWEDFLDAVHHPELMTYTYAPGGGDLDPERAARLSAPIEIVGEAVGELNVLGGEATQWTPEDNELLQAVARQVAEQIENLRLLAQADQYRAEAEQAARQMTRSGWSEFVEHSDAAHGFVYNGETVTPDMEQASLTSAVTQALTVRGEPIGEIAVEAETQSGMPALTPEQQRIIDAVADQLSAHIENLRLLDANQAALAETEKLYVSNARLSAATTLEEALQAAAQPGIAREADSARLFIVNTNAQGQPDSLTVAATWERAGAPLIPVGTHFKLAEHAFMQWWLSDKYNPIFIEDANADARLDPAGREIYVQTRTVGSVLLPLAVDNRWVGLILVNWAEPHTFSEADQRLYRVLAGQSAVVVNNRLLYEDAQRRARREAIINTITQRIQGTASIESALQTAVQEIGVALRAQETRVEFGPPGAGQGKETAPGENGHPANGARSGSEPRRMS